MTTNTLHSRAFPQRAALRRLLLLGTTAWPLVAGAQAVSPVIAINADAGTAAIVTTPVRDNISMLSGSGGNISVLTGPDGKFMVDGGIAVSQPRISAALDKISNAPLKYLVDTHYHWDHSDGNVWLHAAGATILSTPKTKERVSRSIRVDDWDYTFKPLPAAGLPSVMITKPTTYQFDGQTIVLTPVPPAHTDTDLYVYFRQADVLSAGDLFWNGVYPFIDNENGGGIDGMIQADNLLLAVVTDKTIVVPGHGDLGGRKELTAFRDMLITIRANVAALKKQGKTLAEVQAAKPTAAYDAVYGHFVIGPDLFTKIVYDGLK